VLIQIRNSISEVEKEQIAAGEREDYEEADRLQQKIDSLRFLFSFFFFCCYYYFFKGKRGSFSEAEERVG
jgi:hypothetical protein